MTDVTMSSEMTVKLIASCASDDDVIQAAQVSLLGENKPDTVPERLINYLVEAQHGSPFEHTFFKFYVSAPIFVFREFHRHRIASYNEMSGRYTKLLPKFYTPAPERPLVNVGTSARPEFAPGDMGMQALVRGGDHSMAQLAWDTYEDRLNAGVANEIARTILPVSIYSEMYASMNARSLMNFLKLRVDSPDAVKRTRPQREIQMVAEQMEAYFASLMPVTHAAFVRNGRQSP